MLSLYNTCKAFGLRPSDQIKVYDEWAAFQFDDVIAWFGIWIENKLSEYDPVSKEPMYHIDQLLADYEEEKEITYEDNIRAISQLSSIAGAVKVRKKK